MKKTILIAILLLSLVLAGCGSEPDPRIETLEAQLAQLQSRVEVLEAQAAGNSDYTGAQTYEPMAELMLYNWSFEAGVLTISDAFARVMNVPEGIAGAKLVLYHNGAATEQKALDMLPGEGSGSYEMEIGALSLHLPTLTEGDQLGLVLEVTLSSGTILTAEDCAWDYTDGQLLTVAG